MPDPTANMTKKQAAAYQEALRRIEACLKSRSGALDLSNLGLTVLPPEIWQLTALRGLSLTSNQLSMLPPEIGQLTALRLLYLRSNQLSTLPPVIGQLTELTELSLGSNQLSTLPPEIGQLTELTSLTLGSNQLSTLPPEIGQLTALTRLNLDSNQLSTLPPVIGQLTALRLLYLRSNQLSTLPPVIGQLTALTGLSLSNNQLSTLPPVIGQLTALTVLDLSFNQLSALPPEIGHLAHLEQLLLENNSLKSLPETLASPSRLKELTLHGNEALGLPTEVLGPTYQKSSEKNPPADPASILRSYFALQRGNQPLHEVKLVLIGRGSVGKTSLTRALMGEPFNERESETPGIGIGTWDLDCHGTQIKVHVWDFAGQEITHEAHRFFLTERCLYLVVTEGRQGMQDMDADHWLAHVEQYGTHEEDGKPAQTSPALVVANKVDLSACPLERRRLQREHPCVQGFLETDCKSGKGIQELKEKICHLINSPEMDSVRQPFPTEWHRMKQLMQSWKQLNRHFFTFQEFSAECVAHGVQEGDQLALTHVLNQLGIALYYGQNPRLRDTRVLDPQWLANGLYALLRGVEKYGDEQRPGELSETEVEQRLKQGLELMQGKLTITDYPPEARKFLLELMEDRELCFVARETDHEAPIYLLPGLLPKDEPADLDLEPYFETTPDQVKVRFAYKLLPEGLIPRFIVRTHSLSGNKPRWRRGVLLQWSGAEEPDVSSATALVRADMKAMRIEVTVQGGTELLRQELVGIVRTHLKNIHAELPKALEPKEFMELSPEGEQWEEISTLELAAQQGSRVQVKVADKLVELLPQPELIKVEKETAWEEDAEARALRVFISYSHKDHQYLKALTTTYLAVLETDKLIHRWTDGEIRAGEDWDKRIRDEMRRADIVILLLSEDFFASRYIQGVEIELAKARHAAGELEIIPVLLSGETWKEDKHAWLRKLQIAPKVEGKLDLVPLLDFPRRQAKGWEVVQKQLRKVITEIIRVRGFNAIVEDMTREDVK